MPIKDPEKRKAAQQAAQKRHYEKNKEAIKAKVKARKTSLRAWWREFKSTLCCWHCGETHPDCIELHHVITSGKSSKHDISAYWTSHFSRSKRRIMEDLENCVPLCANCHRKVHAMHREILREQAASAA